VAQLVEPPTLDVSSGFDLRVVSSSPMLSIELTLKKKGSNSMYTNVNMLKIQCQVKKVVEQMRMILFVYTLCNYDSICVYV